MKKIAPLLALFQLFYFTPSALSHIRLISTDPADGAVLEVYPKTVTFMFSAQASEKYSQFFIKHETIQEKTKIGSRYITFAGNDILLDISTYDQGPGRYTTSYDVLSQDGHIVSTEIVFEVIHPTISSSNPQTTKPNGFEMENETNRSDTLPISSSQDSSGGNAFPVILSILIGIIVVIFVRIKKQHNEKN